jgi:hypothetical protein
MSKRRWYLFAVFGLAAATMASPASAAESRASEVLPNGYGAGHWESWTPPADEALSSGEISGALVDATPTPQTVDPPPGSECPGSAIYPGDDAIWTCHSITFDNGGVGHPVWLRQGRSGSNGFGWLHALLDHNVQDWTIEHIIQINAAGEKQSNGRFLYGAKFIVKGKPVEYAVLFEERKRGSGSPDVGELGVVTAYCKNAAGNNQNQCPDWVNETL